MSTSEREPLEGTDYVFEEPPWWAVGPLTAVSMDLTYDEAHAMLLGLVGVLLGLTWSAGLTMETGALLLTLVAVAFGLKKIPGNVPIARRIVRKEPWYFTTVLVAATALTVGATEVLA